MYLSYETLHHLVVTNEKLQYKAKQLRILRSTELPLLIIIKLFKNKLEVHTFFIWKTNDLVRLFHYNILTK